MKVIRIAKKETGFKRIPSRKVTKYEVRLAIDLLNSNTAAYRMTKDSLFEPLSIREYLRLTVKYRAIWTTAKKQKIFLNIIFLYRQIKPSR